MDPTLLNLPPEEGAGLPPAEMGQDLQGGAETETPETTEAQGPLLPIVEFSDEQQKNILNRLNAWKIELIQNALSKKNMQRRCFSYINNNFYSSTGNFESGGDDLLPVYDTDANNNDKRAGRPNVFLPISKQQYNLLFAQIKGTLFPSDTGWGRIRAKDEAGAEYEEAMTAAFEVIAKEHRLADKFGAAISAAIWGSNCPMYPTVKTPISWVWQMDPDNGQMVPYMKEGKPTIELETWNPINFYMDPNARDRDTAGWGYFIQGKKREVLDNPYAINKDKLKDLGKNQIEGQMGGGQANNDLKNINLLQQSYTDIEKNLDLDYYYVPYLELDDGFEIRNFFFCVANNMVLVEARPNMDPQGLNPVTVMTWQDYEGTPYGGSPIEDITAYQKTLNIMLNYTLDWMARNGNQWIVGKNVDLSQFFGVGGGIATTDNPGQDVVPIIGRGEELQWLQNGMAVFKSEAQITAGGDTQFQGGNNVDFKKTATEIQLLNENGATTKRERIEHIGSAVCIACERILSLMADQYKEPLKVRINMNGQTQDIMVDFSMWKTGKFTFEMPTINPGQSKQAQVEGITRLVGMVESPDDLYIMTPILEKLGELWGIKDAAKLLEETQIRAEQRKQQAMQEQLAQMAAVQQQSGVGPGPNGPVA